MDFEELIEIGKENRKKYLALDVVFKENLIKFVK
jgi:hypothetical protein